MSDTTSVPREPLNKAVQVKISPLLYACFAATFFSAGVIINSMLRDGDFSSREYFVVFSLMMFNISALMIFGIAVANRKLYFEGLNKYVTLRDLFWLTLTVGLLLGWWSDRSNMIDRYDEYIYEHVNWRWCGGTPMRRQDVPDAVRDEWEAAVAEYAKRFKK